MQRLNEVLNRSANSPRPGVVGRSSVSLAYMSLFQGMILPLPWHVYNQLSTVFKDLQKFNRVHFDKKHATWIKYKTSAKFYPSKQSEQYPQCTLENPVVWLSSVRNC